MNYGTINLNIPFNRLSFISHFNEYLKKKNATKLTHRAINMSLRRQSVESLHKSLLHLKLSIKGSKEDQIKRLEKDIHKLVKNYDL